MQGNYYFGTQTRSATHVIPAGYQNDGAYEDGVGAIIKYAAGSSGHAVGDIESWRVCSAFPLVKTTAGSLRVYSPGYAPFGAGNSSGFSTCCSCRSPRFDVDYYGRLFIPNAVTKEVSVVDNNDNLIMKFGQYGNVDSRGGLPGPGTSIPTPAFPLAYPVSAAASEDYLYVGDMNNWRMMRVRMDYALDNLPGLTDKGSAVSLSGPRLAEGWGIFATPNPFMPSVSIECMIPGQTRGTYRICNAQGRVVFSRDIASGRSGTRVRMSWDGRNLQGIREASGLYVGKLVLSDGKTLTHKLMLVR
jgi:hypothetical protein